MLYCIQIYVNRFDMCWLDLTWSWMNERTTATDGTNDFMINEEKVEFGVLCQEDLSLNCY